MRAIIKKDFMSNFHTFTGWLFTAVLWGFVSFFIANYNFLALSSQITRSLTAVEIVFLILMPILCMRSFADEQRQKTDQILLTSPVSVGKVVLGKFTALGLVYSITVLMICVYPVILSAFGNVNYAVNYVGIIGMWLYGLACIAICIFASSLTENPIIAAVLGFVFLFIGYLIPSIQNMVSSSHAGIARVIGALDITSRFEAFLSGTFDLSALIYLVSAAALFLFLTTQVIQKRRYSVSKKTLSFGAYSSAMIVISIIIAVVVNLAASRLPESWKNVDLTSTGLYSISDDTKEMLDGLDQDVTIYVLNKEENADSTLSRLLDNYKGASSHIKVEYIDPASNPSFIQQYTTDTSSLYMNSLVVVCGDRSKIINYSDIYQTSIDYETYQQTNTGFDGEGQVTSAINYVTSSDLPKVYVLTGHGEQSLSENFSEALSKMNIDSEELNLLQADSVPDDAQAVLILGPTSDLSTDDVQKLEAYFEKGGNLIAETNYQATGDMTNYKSLLAWYGISVSDGVVLDSDSSRYYQYPSYLLPNVENSSITSDVNSGNGFVMVPFAQELTTDDSSSDVSYTPLLMTSEDAYIHDSVESASELAATDNDQMAARTVGVEAVKTVSSDGVTSSDATASSDTDAASTAIVYSSPFIFNDNASQLVSGSNLLLFNGSVSAVVKNDSSVSIPVKEFQDTTLTITARTAMTLLVIFVVIIPAVLIVLGLFIWLRRRKL